jgi:hypothetical protein
MNWLCGSSPAGFELQARRSSRIWSGLRVDEDRRRRINYLNDNGQIMIQMAEKLGFPALGEALAQAFKETAEAEFEPALRGPNPRNKSFLLAPQSYQRVMDGLATRLKGVASAKAAVSTDQTEGI